MPLVSCTVDRILVIRWTGVPVEADLPAFDEAIANAKKNLPTPQFHIAILPAVNELPAMSLYKSLIKRAKRLEKQCQTLHGVYEGSGVRDAIARRFLKGLVTTMGLK